jgi:nitrite reductase/ring-hydroxylating ferredoxin subunit
VASDGFQRVAVLSEVPRGATLCITFEEREILLCHTAEGLFAVDNLCSHAEARLCDGRLKGYRIFCPLHGGAFDVRDGSALARPATVPIPTYAVRLEGEDVLLCPDPL